MARSGRARLGFAALVAGALLAAGLSGAAAADGSPDGSCPPPDGRQFCLSVSLAPGEVSASSEGAPSFISSTITVRNVGGSTLTQVTIAACLVAGEDGRGCAPAPPGASFTSAVAGAGTCTISGATANCKLGSLPGGGVATVELVARAPSEPGPFRNVVTATVNEGSNDNPASDPNRDTATVAALGAALAPGPTATSFVPSGTALALSAEAGGQTGEVTIPAEHDALTAALAITDTTPLVCPKREVCRGGAWVDASVPGTFEMGLRFRLSWPAALVPSKQTTKNFVLFYLACDGCELEVIRARCSSATPAVQEMPCLWNIRDLRTNGFEATLVSTHNGKMH